MNFVIPFLGKTKSIYLDQGIKDFSKRLTRFGNVELPLLKSRSGRNSSDEEIMLLEAEQLLAKADEYKKKKCISLDTSGRALSSEELALFLQKMQQEGSHTAVFFIGGFAGLHPCIKNKSDSTLSLSRLTFTHEMARLMLLEQLYRAETILAGHNYHK